MTCDVCNTAGSGTIVAAARMSAAVREGFNPITLGIVPDTLKFLGLPGGAESWAESATVGAASRTDWDVCAGCVKRLEPYLSGGTAGPARPVSLPGRLPAAAAEPARPVSFLGRLFGRKSS